jgi:hypothetical protein
MIDNRLSANCNISFMYILDIIIQYEEGTI